MNVYREITSVLTKVSKQFPVVAIMGPRQSGKTTLVKQTFPDYAYVTLEDIDIKISAKEDPRRFFATYTQEKGLIIDEIQEVPELFSYMQGIVDQKYRPGFFVITGSQNLSMLEKITQTLAGRIALLTLLPLTISELINSKIFLSPEEVMFQGLYPRIYAQKIDVNLWLLNYLSTYVERDVRQILNIGDVLSFQKFLRLCAARVGNLINYAELARDSDISPNTAKAWLSVLEASYIIKLLQPYHKNFSKRIIKSPKLYFYDSGLVCSLLGIKDSQELFIHPMRGAIFETLIISEFLKYSYNQGKIPNVYFWRDVQGHEIDCIVEPSFDNPTAIEIKSGMTITSDFFKNIIDWKKITGQKKESYIIYAGKDIQLRSHAKVLPWNTVKKVYNEINMS